MLVVQKYGGTSVENPQRLYAAARRAVDTAREGNEVVLVVSAQGQTTDELIAAAKQVNQQASFRELDAYMASGEQMSAALLAMAIGALGYEAVSLTGWQAGIQTDGIYGDAQITGLCNNRIRQELDQGKIVVIAGFQGIAPNGDITTLGRGGSDTTAVALAGLLNADVCKIYTDVDGVYDKDPRKHADAVRFERIGYDRMLELIRCGAQVLHDRSVERAREYGIALEVLSAFTGLPGTLVGP